MINFDLPADIRDIYYDITHAEGTWESFGQGVVDVVGLVPVIGSVKYIDEGAALIKGTVKSGDEAVDAVKAGRNGAKRAAKYSSEWGNASLKEAINRFAPNVKPMVTAKGKMIYTNPKTGISVVYDKNGNYFRIEDTTRPRGRNYLDINGNDMNNQIIDGKTRGRSKDDYQKVTHFNNLDE